MSNGKNWNKGGHFQEIGLLLVKRFDKSNVVNSQTIKVPHRPFSIPIWWKLGLIVR